MDFLDSATRMKLEKLELETGCNIVQVNGQRRFGPPSNWIGLPPPRGSEVFIGNLPRDLFEYDLVPVLSSVGRIYQFRLMINVSGLNRGFGFAVYSNINEAKRAIQELNGYKIRKDCHIAVVESVDDCRIYLEGIPKKKSKEEIFTELNKLVSGIVDIHLYFKKNFNRGFVYVEFASHRAAAMARRYLVPGVSVLFDRIGWATDHRPDIDDELIEQENPCNQRAQDEGIGAYSVDNFFNSHIETNDMPSEDTKVARYELYEMCKSYGWALPEYFCRTHKCSIGIGCISYLEVQRVKLPLMNALACITFTSKLCNTCSQAQENAAQQAVQYFKEKNTSISTPTPLQPFYQSPTTNVYNTHGYNFTNCEIHQSAPLAPRLTLAHWH